MLALGISSASQADGKYHGATVTIDFKAADFGDLMRVLGDTGRVNIVLVDVAPTRLDVTVTRKPWDQVLDELVARAQLGYERKGNVYVVGQPAMITERKKRKPVKYSGVTMDLDVQELPAVTAAALVASATGHPFEIKPGAARDATLRIRRVPSDQAAELIVLQTGGTRVDKPTPVAAGTGCIAAKVPLGNLRLAGIAAVGTKRWAAVLDDKQVAYILGRDRCVGAEQASVKEIGDGYLTFTVGTSEVSVSLHPTKLQTP